MNLYDKVFPPKVIVLPNGKNVTKPRSRAPLAAAVLCGHGEQNVY